jgi:hypothetical protein
VTFAFKAGLTILTKEICWNTALVTINSKKTRDHHYNISDRSVNKNKIDRTETILSLKR